MSLTSGDERGREPSARQARRAARRSLSPEGGRGTPPSLPPDLEQQMMKAVARIRAAVKPIGRAVVKRDHSPPIHREQTSRERGLLLDQMAADGEDSGVYDVTAKPRRTR